MKVQLGEGPAYEVESEILDLLALQYGNLMLEKYNQLDTTVQFAGKILGKRIVSELAKVFGISSKLPRGSDPIIYLIRAYTVILRQSLDMATLTIQTDETTHTIVDQRLEYDPERLTLFSQTMSVYLERLKAYARTDIPRLAEATAADQGGTGPELVVGGDEEVGEDDGGENHYLVPVPVVS